MTRSGRWVAACVAIALALRVAFALAYWVGQPLTHDEREYLALARNIARGEGFRYPADEPSPGTAQQFGRAPGYPLFLAALRVTAPADHAPRRVQIAQACVGALGVWLIASIAGRAAGPRAACVAAAVAAVYPPLIFMPAYVLSETLYSTIALAAARVLQEVGGWKLEAGETPIAATSGLEPRDSDLPSRTSHVAPRTSDLAPRTSPLAPRPSPLVPRPALPVGAVLTGLAILTRPAMLFFLPFAVAWLVWRTRHRSPTTGLVRAAVFVAVALACVAPWTIRNHRVYGRWIAVASEGGVTFWTGNHPLAVGDGDLAANLELKRAELAFRASHPDLSAEQLEPFYYRDALSWIRRDPVAWLALMARKAFYCVVPIGPSYALHSPRYRAASALSYLLVLSAALVGAWRWRAAVRPRADQTSGRDAEDMAAVDYGPSPAPLWLLAAATVAAGLVFFPQERFRLPVIDPALIVTAALPAGLRKR